MRPADMQRSPVSCRSNAERQGRRNRRRRNILRTKLFAEAINRHGDAEILILRDIGIRGNTHWPMLDNNNYQIADLLSKYLRVGCGKAACRR